MKNPPGGGFGWQAQGGPGDAAGSEELLSRCADRMDEKKRPANRFGGPSGDVLRGAGVALELRGIRAPEMQTARVVAGRESARRNYQK